MFMIRYCLYTFYTVLLYSPCSLIRRELNLSTPSSHCYKLGSTFLKIPPPL